MSEWGPWGPCSKKRKLCGFKKGNEERTRRILHAPSGDVSLCPATTEVRRCTVQKNQCPEGEQTWNISPSLPSTLYLSGGSIQPIVQCHKCTAHLTTPLWYREHNVTAARKTPGWNRHRPWVGDARHGLPCVPRTFRYFSFFPGQRAARQLGS